MSQNGNKTSETGSAVEVEKTNKRVWAEIVEKTNLALQKIKNKKARTAEKKAG